MIYCRNVPHRANGNSNAVRQRQIEMINKYGKKCV